MKIDFLADTNFLIYLHEGKSIVSPFLDFNFGISFISEVELLGYIGISKQEEVALRGLIGDCFYLDWSGKLKEKTIDLRKKYRIKLPDAIIASTSIIYGIPLVTADKQFTTIAELDVILLET